MMNDEKDWKKDFNIIYQNRQYFIHKDKEGNMHLIDENTYMAIRFDEAEWCCPFDNWVLFLKGEWVGYVSIDEGDDFFENLCDIRQKRIIAESEYGKPKNSKERNL